MERARQRDLEAVLAYLRGIYAHRDLEGFAAHLVATLPEIVPSELTAYQVFDAQNRTISAYTNPDMPHITEAGEIFRQHAHEHPLLNHYRRTRDNRPLKISDFLTQRQYHRLGLYNELYRALETEHQMGFGFVASTFLAAVVINRSDGDFSERDRLRLDLLRPHLAQAYRNAESVTRLGEDVIQARQAIEELDRGAVSLVGKDRVLWSTRRAREWISEYFGPCPRTDRLPEYLRRWVERQVSLLWTDSDVPPPREPLVMERADKRLVARLVADPTNDLHLLLMEEWHAPLAAKALRPLGLTPREEEILLLIARGNTDKDVAAQLYISPRTVMKHLQHVYDKLGVGSRTEAIAQALETRGCRRE